LALFRFAVTAVFGLCSLTSLSAQAVKPDLSLLPYGNKPDLVALPNGREIHMVCMGHGSPTVVMTAGLADWSVTWNKVQPAIARRVRVCAWDRAGFGFSGPGPEPQTVDWTTTDLERALVAAKIRGPYIVVGHSSGSYETLLFKDRHPTEVVGMVLIDPAYPDQAALSARDTPLLAAATRAWDEGGAAISLRCAALLESGALKVGGADPDGCLSIPPEYPDLLRERSLKLYTNPEMWKTAASLFATFAESSHLIVDKDRTYGAMPMRVLTADSLLAAPNASPAAKAEMPTVREEWQHQHDQLAALSSRGVNIRVAGTEHAIQQMKPQAVIAAIAEVIRQARESK
jgi:pimeloyl-ACP methyl ester carboxylesterase